MKLLFSQVKPLVARVLGVCEDDEKVADYTNEAARRLLSRGMFAGCYGRFTIALTDGCITLPRPIESIVTAASCCGQVTVRNQWYEFNDGGFGLLSCDNCGINQLVDRGTVVSYRDMSGGTNSYLRAYAFNVADDGKFITVQGYDDNGNWVRTATGPSGSMIDGERLELPNINTDPNDYVQSTTKFTALTGVIKDPTTSKVLLYEYNATAATELDLANYEPDETLPQYRRMQWTAISESNTETRHLTIMARMKHLDVQQDNDYVIPPCPDAIKLMVKAIDFEEKNLPNDSVVYEQKAVAELMNATRAYLGDAVGVVRRVGQDLYGGGITRLM